MILINGWEFDFKTMIAYRGLDEKALMFRGNGDIGRRYKHEIRKFFDEPEEHFNDVIQREYLNYTFENQILV